MLSCSIVLGASHNRRQKRDVSPGLSLESLLLPNPRHSHVVEFDLILNDDQYKTVSAIGKHDVYSRSSRRRSKRKAVRHSIYHWPYAEVPYEIHSSVGEWLTYCLEFHAGANDLNSTVSEIPA